MKTQTMKNTVRPTEAKVSAVHHARFIENAQKLTMCGQELLKKQMKIEIIKELAPKLNDVNVFFTLIKGFVGSGILFMPNGFSNGGWGFSTFALILSMVLTLTSIILLLEVSDHYEGSF